MKGHACLGADHNPIMIGRLQRYAMDWIAVQKDTLFRSSLRPPANESLSSAPDPPDFPVPEN